MMVQLYRDGKEILGSDGVMHVDGRFNVESIRLTIKDRNTRYAKNLPRKVADSFACYKGRIGGPIGRIIHLNHN